MTTYLLVSYSFCLKCTHRCTDNYQWIHLMLRELKNVIILRHVLFSMISKQIFGRLFAMDVGDNDILRSKSL